MNEKRKEIILSEIKYWRQNNLLPEHYCDFLATLYSEGEDEEQQLTSKNSSILQKEKNKKRNFHYMITIFTVIAGMSTLYFNNEWLLFLGAGIVGILFAFVMTKVMKKQVIPPLLHVLLALSVLLFTIKVWMLYFSTEFLVLVGILIVNCLIWLIVGRYYKILYFTLSGGIGLICIAGFIFFQS